MDEHRVDQPTPRPPEAVLRDAGSSQAVLRDALGRRINYLRVSLTDRCNLRCVYCMPPEGVPKLQHAEILSLEELAEIVRLLVTDLGITKVRVTGGEPLIRRGVIPFCEPSAGSPASPTSRSRRTARALEEFAADIRDAGVRRLNISLDTLRAERFLALTGVDGFEAVMRGIAAARRAGFQPIKLNVVVMRSILDEAADLLRFGIEQGLEVRFIELMASHMPQADEFVPAQELIETLSREFELTPLQSGPAATPAAGASDCSTGAARLYSITPLPVGPAQTAADRTASARANAFSGGGPGAHLRHHRFCDHALLRPLRPHPPARRRPSRALPLRGRPARSEALRASALPSRRADRVHSQDGRSQQGIPAARAPHPRHVADRWVNAEVQPCPPSPTWMPRVARAWSM